MSVIGIGSDIVKIERIEKLIKRYKDRFSGRIFTNIETAYANSKARPAIHFAARFAAKEAYVKALGVGLRKGLNWTDIEIVNNNLGKPQIKLYNHARQLAEKLDHPTIWLTLTHEQEFALAFVILEK